MDLTERNAVVYESWWFLERELTSILHRCNVIARHFLNVFYLYHSIRAVVKRSRLIIETPDLIELCFAQGVRDWLRLQLWVHFGDEAMKASEV